MELLSVKQAAALLGVDDSRVRQLLHDGKLQGQRVGGRWLVAGDSVRDRKDRGPRSRRPLSARNAWGVLAVLDGHQPVGLSDAEKSRVRMRVRNLLAHEGLAPAVFQELLAARAEVRSYRVHSGVLMALLAAQDVVRGGVSAAARVGADYVALGRAEIYVHPEKVEKLEAEFGLARDEERGNVSLRIPPAEMWSFLISRPGMAGQGHDAPASVVAADLLDLHEGRADAAAAGLLKPLLARYTQPRKA
ncbi:helix-turn-helix domain-containing protein [Streptomyces sp. ISL-43]|uniref:helix-turn-helix domain-containing protein n=1 Tax=Streptomyces sp. ISL-43 TaxID=2819183 RepID=UPI001BEB1B7D|nr:helix-turn-helix domain-containing protein [Streptomyces sp. ISL-43]MBT2452542.1 helix-turn-helix domain-containing protein [Streptomyces sp. ISL-43]